jgi:hypothetical protein
VTRPQAPTVCRIGVFYETTREQVRGTLGLLRYYRRAARELPDGVKCGIPGRNNWGFYMDSLEAVSRLYKMQAEAILRKAGTLPPLNHRGKPCRKWEGMEQVRMTRDCYRVRERVNKRVRVYQLETEAVRRRFGYLLSRDDED